jgi:fibronectin type III domain protein
VVPLAPTGVSATAGVASITISWSAPASNGANITGYRATASPGGNVCSTSGATTCVVGGTAGTAYTISVVALSDAGPSAASASSSAVTPTELTVPSSAPDTSLPLETPDGPITSTSPGATLRMSGTGYAPFSQVTLAVYSEPRVLGTITADEDGAFDTEIDVPSDLSGKHSFVAAGVDMNGDFRALRLDLTVSASDGSLPVTGTATLWMIVAGFATVMTGVTVRRYAIEPTPRGRHRNRRGGAHR